MSKQEIRHPDKATSTATYSAAVAADGWVYVSGIGPVDPQTGQAFRGSIEDETRHVLGQLDKILSRLLTPRGRQMHGAYRGY